MTGELDAFADDGGDETHSPEDEGVQLDVLVFQQGDSLLGIEARWVDSVIPWRAPATLPLAALSVAGVVQDRGRVVVVRKARAENAEPRRIIVCSTDQGLVGVPATTTRAVGVVTVVGDLRFGEPIDTSEGVMTLLDPEHLAADMVEP